MIFGRRPGERLDEKSRGAKQKRPVRESESAFSPACNKKGTRSSTCPAPCGEWSQTVGFLIQACGSLQHLLPKWTPNSDP